jgi:hypothetical protein
LIREIRILATIGLTVFTKQFSNVLIISMKTLSDGHNVINNLWFTLWLWLRLRGKTVQKIIDRVKLFQTLTKVVARNMV